MSDSSIDEPGTEEGGEDVFAMPPHCTICDDDRPLKPIDGFIKCQACGASYGPVEDNIELGSLAHQETLICDGCNVNEPWEHRCHGEPCPCEECRESDRIFDNTIERVHEMVADADSAIDVSKLIEWLRAGDPSAVTIREAAEALQRLVTRTGTLTGQVNSLLIEIEGLHQEKDGLIQIERHKIALVNTLQSENVELLKDAVPRSRYNVVLGELDVAKEFTAKVQADAGAEIEGLHREVERLRALKAFDEDLLSWGGPNERHP